MSPKKIFISYRVQDTAADTGRLVDALKQVFYEDQIFMDIEKLEPGVDFTQAIAHSLDSCDVLFAIIGPEWAGPANQKGVTRINQPNDWVRIELETALKRNIRLIPVLVRGASLPGEEELPESLHPLLNRQTYEVSNKRWKYDTDQLISFLTSQGFQSKRTAAQQQVVQRLPEKAKPGFSRWILYTLAVLGALAIIGMLMELGDSNSGAGRYSESYVNGGTSLPPQNAKENEVIANPPADEAKPQETTTAYNVTGSWFDATNQYYMHITQTGNTLELKSVSAAGLATGEGVGTIANHTINFKVQLYNVGVISGTAPVPEDNYILNGKFIIEENGASYTEPFRWTRQGTAAQ
ncbi:MAG: toll/interleukin-1 receptor domain-containing protein [Agriterribacter sp.]